MGLELFDEAIKDYSKIWDELVAERQDKEFFESLKPTAIGWKTTDLAEYDRLFAELRNKCDQIHIGWINERWLATMHLKDTKLESGIEIIKLMQRRPGSTDAVGLDHVDFLAPDLAETKAVLEKEADVKWTEETNNPHCSWISLWFNGTEAKLRDGTVLDVCISELKEVNQKLSEF